MKIPRKKKKIFKKLWPGAMKGNVELKYNSVFHSRMVLVHNYVKAGIPLTLTKQDINFIKNGLIENPKFNIPLNPNA